MICVDCLFQTVRPLVSNSKHYHNNANDKQINKKRITKRYFAFCFDDVIIKLTKKEANRAAKWTYNTNWMKHMKRQQQLLRKKKRNTNKQPTENLVVTNGDCFFLLSQIKRINSNGLQTHMILQNLSLLSSISYVSLLLALAFSRTHTHTYTRVTHSNKTNYWHASTEL